MHLTLARTYLPGCTVGPLTTDAQKFESICQPWDDNRPGHSCVPEGDYELIPHESPHHGQTWALHNPALGVTIDGAGGTRSYCLFHSGNFVEDSEGCTILGLEGKPMYDPRVNKVTQAVEESKEAMQRFRTELVPMSEGHTLSIVKAA